MGVRKLKSIYQRWVFIILLSILATATALPSSLVRAVSGTISGTVFRDFNGNGAADVANPAAGITATDFGVAGITVTAFGPGGYTETKVTGANGGYTLDSAALLALPTNSEIRIEFTGEAAGFYTAVNGGTVAGVANTSVRFLRTTVANMTGIDFGVQIPGEYCQNNPDLATTCFVNGDPTQAGSTVANINSWVGFAYNSNGSVPTPPDYQIGTAGEVGSIWGIAYQRTTNRVFAAATLHAGAGLGQGGTGTSNATGAIYVLNSGAAGPSSFVHFDALATPIATRPGGFPDNATRGLPASPIATTTIVDTAANSVGLVGFGDIDVSEDQTSIWAINLFDSRLYKINIPAAGTLATNADITSFALTSPCGAATMHPWALKPRNGKVYVGVVCDVINVTPTAYVIEVDAVTGAASGAPNFPFNIPLNYAKGRINAGDPTPGANNWTWWQPATDDTTGPQPILADIEFDVDGSIILGFLDRSSMARPRLGPGDTPGAPPKPAGGDILRICAVGAGYQLENNGLCPNSPGTKLSTEPFAPPLPVQGPGGGEFYFDNFEAGGVPNHQEIAIGGLALLPGSGEVVSSTFNPNNGEVFSGGVRHFDNTLGVTNYGYALYTTGTFVNNGYAFGKGVGIGDLELLCNMAPVEIGNRVWLDTNLDGVQTPEEAVIPGVTVELVDNTTGGVVSSAVTDGNGTYYFSNGPDLGLGSGSARYALPLVFGRSYRVRILLSQTALLPYQPTLLNADPVPLVPNPDMRDSDGNPALAAGYVATDFILGTAGQNNHTYDFGFNALQVTPTPSPTLTPTPTQSTTPPTPGTPSTPVAPGTPGAPGTPQLQFGDPRIDKSVDPALALPGDIVTFTITVTNVGTAPTTPVTVSDTLDSSLQIISATTSQGTYTLNGSTFIFTIGVIQPGQVVRMTITCRISSSVTPPLDILNTAVLNGGPQIATALLRVRTTRPNLPATGIPPAPSDSDVNLFTVALVLGIVMAALVLYRRRRLPQNS